MQLSTGFAAEDGVITELLYMPITTEFGYAHAGSVFSVNYGILPFLSVGLTCNALDFLIHGIKDGFWYFDVSVNAKLNIFRNNFYILNFRSEFEANPLFSSPEQYYFGSGLLNLFNTLSSNFILINNAHFSTSLYIDLKHITSFVNQEYGNPVLSLDNIQVPEQWADRDIELGYARVDRIALALGTEVRVDNFNAWLGFNFPIEDFSRGGGVLYWETFDSFLYSLSFTNFELNWSLRL
ncbi:MAG: hypothetical protein ACLFR1_12110 [Spirochaetia bacterium]